MGITINISGGGVAPSMNAPTTTGTALDAGASAALAPAAEGPAAHSHGPESTRDGGAPSPALVQEVEAALQKMRGGKGGAGTSASANATSAGAAPV